MRNVPTQEMKEDWLGYAEGVYDAGLMPSDIYQTKVNGESVVRPKKQQIAMALIKFRYAFDLDPNVSPSVALNQITLVRGRTGIMGKLALALIRRNCPQALIKMHVPTIKTGIPINAKIEVKRDPEQEDWTIYEYTYMEAQAANLIDSTEPWTYSKPDMIMWKCVNKMTKFEFPEYSMGLEDAETLQAQLGIGESSPKPSFLPKAQPRKVIAQKETLQITDGSDAEMQGEGDIKETQQLADKMVKEAVERRKIILKSENIKHSEEEDKAKIKEVISDIISTPIPRKIDVDFTSPEVKEAQEKGEKHNLLGDLPIPNQEEPKAESDVDFLDGFGEEPKKEEKKLDIHEQYEKDAKAVLNEESRITPEEKEVKEEFAELKEALNSLEIEKTEEGIKLAPIRTGVWNLALLNEGNEKALTSFLCNGSDFFGSTKTKRQMSKDLSYSMMNSIITVGAKEYIYDMDKLSIMFPQYLKEKGRSETVCDVLLNCFNDYCMNNASPKIFETVRDKYMHEMTKCVRQLILWTNVAIPSTVVNLRETLLKETGWGKKKETAKYIEWAIDLLKSRKIIKIEGDNVVRG